MSGAAVKPADTVARVASHFGIPVDVLTGPSRVRSVTYARHIAMWLLREQGLSYENIAFAVGRLDHNTALRAVRRIQRECYSLGSNTAMDVKALSKEA